MHTSMWYWKFSQKTWKSTPVCLFWKSPKKLGNVHQCVNLKNLPKNLERPSVCDIEKSPKKLGKCILVSSFEKSPKKLGNCLSYGEHCQLGVFIVCLASRRPAAAARLGRVKCRVFSRAEQWVQTNSYCRKVNVSMSIISILVGNCTWDWPFCVFGDCSETPIHKDRTKS